MDAIEWSTGVYAAAVAMAQCMTREELTARPCCLHSWAPRWPTIAALKNLEEGTGEEIIVE